MAEYQLYCFAQSGNCYRAALMLSVIGADWEPIFVDFFKAGVQRTPDYRENINDYQRGLHDLQRPLMINGECRTRGYPAIDAVIETRGIGASTLLIWPRIGTYRETQLTTVSCGEK